MITASINPSDLNKLRQTLGSISKTFDPADRRKIFSEASEPIIDAMKSRTPVDTGRLRDSIGVDPKKGVKAGVVFVGVVGKRKTKKNKATNPGIYGKYVEFGTRKQKAQPFLRPGFDGTKNRVISIIARLFERHIKTKLARS